MENELNGQEMVRLIDSIHRDKGIDKEALFESIEAALYSAAKKKFGSNNDLILKINRRSGGIEAYEEGRRVAPSEFGRIAAQTAKQVIIQKIREAERDVIFDEYENKVDALVNGVTQRFERGAIIVNLGRNAEGIIPRSEQVPSEHYRPGDRIRAYVVKVEKKGQRVRIILSRTHPNVVKELFELEVPEISDRIVEIKGLVREPGYRTKIAVTSNDPKVDAIGACVGVRGSRIRNIVDELNGEKIDIVRWSDTPEQFIRNSLSPAEISNVELDKDENRARVVVPVDQLKLAIGKKGQNVRLTAKLTRWHIDILSEEQARELREAERSEIYKIPFLSETERENLIIAGFQSLRTIILRGQDSLVATVSGMDVGEANKIVEYAEKRYEEWVEERRAMLEAEQVEIEVAVRAESGVESESGKTPEKTLEASVEQKDEAEAGAVNETIDETAGNAEGTKAEAGVDAGGQEA